MFRGRKVSTQPLRDREEGAASVHVIRKCFFLEYAQNVDKMRVTLSLFLSFSLSLSKLCEIFVPTAMLPFLTSVKSSEEFVNLKS